MVLRLVMPASSFVGGAAAIRTSVLVEDYVVLGLGVLLMTFGFVAFTNRAASALKPRPVD